MTVFTEPVHAGEHLVSEANGNRSRSVKTITGGAFTAATVLGAIAFGAAAAVADAGNTGNGTISAVTLGDDVKTGVYSIIFTAATKFNVIDPDGFAITEGTVGEAYDDDIGFTITAGGTAFVAGDSIAITVTEGSGKLTKLALAASDGSQKAAGVLFAGVNAADADVEATVHDRDCEVNAHVLVWPNDITDEQKAAAIKDLADLGVIVRS
ncbi:head decoration protein [uncultured Cohaesibacter sp.]|uniref:head decoration protein n=1 Tax=uncultured Cohaesibacter sp. TaxID=1002546 RepID=UPI0029C7BBC1|nr:head decoration protein [uncultured Cohaesibacter sp.]